MTNRQAIDVLHCVDAYGVADEARKLAIKALEKQIPTKPKGGVEFVRTLLGREYYYTCPTCGNELLKKRMNERQDTRFCWDCGQKLDWGESE